MELRGDKVVLRPTGPDDGAVLASIVREPAVARWWAPPPENFDRMLAIVMTADGRADDRTYGRTDGRADGQIAAEPVIGAIQFQEETDPGFRHAGIDIFVATAHQGRGLGPDAVRTLARWLIRERGHHRLVIDPAAANTAAIRSYRKVGFKPVGIMRQYALNPATGQWQDGLLMDLLADELT